MKKSLLGGLLALCLAFPLQVWAGADDYMGDAAIYSGDPISVRPNVLVIIDNSKATLQPAVGYAYDPNVDYSYAGGRNRNDIYTTDQSGAFNVVAVDVPDTDSALDALSCDMSSVVKDELLASGTYAADGSSTRPIIKANKDQCEQAPMGSVYALGNYLNYTENPVNGEAMTQRELVFNALKTVLNKARVTANLGAAVYGENNKGLEVIYNVTDLSDSVDAYGNVIPNSHWNDFLAVLPGSGQVGSAPAITAGPQRPQSEALYDAGAYFGAGYPSITETSQVPSAIANTCGIKYNQVIFITNGLSNAEGDPKLQDNIGNADDSNGDGVGDVVEYDTNGDGAIDQNTESYPDVTDEDHYGLGVHYLDDVAYKLHNEGILTTNMVLAFQSQDPLIIRTAAEGGGQFYNVYSSNELEKALLELIVNIVLEEDTSFVAPVVPASTTNRTFSSNRVYLGLFKPKTQQPWLGNLKKYGVDSNNRLIDRYGDPATDADGNFEPDSLSYWGTDSSNNLMEITGDNPPAKNAKGDTAHAGDGGDITAGGAGGSLLARTTPRNIYTYLGANVDLTDSSNAFNSTNMTAALMGIADDNTRNNLITYIRGGTGSADVFDADDDNDKGEERPWLMGDILHSKPVVLHYSSAAMSDENNCSQNKSMLFVGSNDGMLHAINDCDGSEAWAFIPDNLLSDLQYLKDNAHNYYVDSSPSAYVHDKNGDGNIDPATDKVVIIFGERRGGGKDTLASGQVGGAYYALDVTNPAVPKFLWKIDNQTQDSNGTEVFSELGEPWGQPRLAKVKVGTTTKIVAFISGGYDTNEDLRYGNTQTYPSATDATTDTTGISFDSGVVTSSHGADAYNPKGRGLFAVDIADLTKDNNNKYDADITSHGGELVWKHTAADDPYMRYCIPSDLSVQDMNADSYQDRIYVGDSHGRLWRFDVGDSDTNNWTGRVIFRANLYAYAEDGVTPQLGRKFFYKPAVSIKNGQATLYIGSGDREHPLNRGVVDRIYSIIDKGQGSSDYYGEANLVDVTNNELQLDTTTADEINTILNNLASSTNYGWYIRLNENSGEKVLAPAEVYNKNAFFTTYSPDLVDLDPCTAGNLGTSRLYQLDYETGEAVYNYDTRNDTSGSTITNDRMLNDDGKVLARSDRVKTIGVGIPSGIVTLIDASGKVTMMISSSNRVSTYSAPDARLISPVYWMQW